MSAGFRRAFPPSFVDRDVAWWWQCAYYLFYVFSTFTTCNLHTHLVVSCVFVVLLDMYDPSLFVLVDVHDADQRASYIEMASAQLDRSSTPVLREHVLWFRAYATICGLLASCACSTHTFLFDFADLHCAQRFLDVLTSFR